MPSLGCLELEELEESCRFVEGGNHPEVTVSCCQHETRRQTRLSASTHRSDSSSVSSSTTSKSSTMVSASSTRLITLPAAPAPSKVLEAKYYPSADDVKSRVLEMMKGAAATRR